MTNNPRPFQGRPLSIRVTLLGIIGFLNLLIATQAAYHAYESYINLKQADAVRTASKVLDGFYNAANALSLERGASMSIFYTPPAIPPNWWPTCAPTAKRPITRWIR